MSHAEHPVFESGTRVALVQRIDNPERFAVAIRDHRLVYPLPEGYDGRTSVNFDDGWVVIGHPEMNPLVMHPLTGQVTEVDRVQLARAGFAGVRH